MIGLKFKVGFHGLTNKRDRYKKAIKDFKKDSEERVQSYGKVIYETMKKDVPVDLGNLSEAITGPEKYKITNSHVKIRLEPFVPYWVFQEFGLKEPRWVVVDTKPDLVDWVARHGVKTTVRYWKEMDQDVHMLWIGGENTKLGKENKFVENARKFMNEHHKESLSLMAEKFRKSLPHDDGTNIFEVLNSLN